ncbi:MAG: o-succinylbenzoate--CoA ligase [Lachnospiraceae bacterium]|nr:o-succinylbenzoate--CoA ligase [Lachnospiraceae bacterium]
MFLGLDRQDKTKIAVKDNEGYELTYGQLASEMEYIARLLKARSIVFNLCKNTVGSLVGYLGFIEGDSVPLALSSKIERGLLDELISEYTPAYLWIPSEMASNFGYPTIFQKYGYVLLETGNKPYPINNDLQFLMTTSGSTGSPKLVRYKKGNLEANAKNVAAAFGWTSDERPICDLGMQYTMGLNVINTHLYVGATVLLITYNLMSADFWDYISEEKATNFTGVPFSYDILYRLHFDRMDLPHLTTLSEGGGKLTDARFIQLAEYAKKNGKRFIASFGTTETSARMACLPAELAMAKTGSIGRAIPEGELFLIDENGNEVTEPDGEGELCYRGPNVTMGYASRKEELLNGDDFKGEYHTGDLARRDADGCYFVTGRMSRFLKLLSYRVSLDQCERLIQEEFGIECACTGTDHRMDIYITDETKKKGVLEYISEKTNLFKTLFKVFVIERIPRNDSGKIKYKELGN